MSIPSFILCILIFPLSNPEAIAHAVANTFFALKSFWIILVVSELWIGPHMQIIMHAPEEDHIPVALLSLGPVLFEITAFLASSRWEEAEAAEILSRGSTYEMRSLWSSLPWGAVAHPNKSNSHKTCPTHVDLWRGLSPVWLNEGQLLSWWDAEPYMLCRSGLVSRDIYAGMSRCLPSCIHPPCALIHACINHAGRCMFG